MSHDPIVNFIGGTWQAASSGRKTLNHNPATGELLGEVTASGPEEVEQAVAAARAALPAWRSLPAPKRGEILLPTLGARFIAPPTVSSLPLAKAAACTARSSRRSCPAT